MPDFTTEVKKALQKIEERLGIVPKDGKFVYKQTGASVRKAEDRAQLDTIFDSIADCTLADVERMIQREDRSDDTAIVVPQTLIPILDGRLVRPEANDLDRDLLHCLRVPYAEDREARTIAREDGCLVYIEGQKATRVASECLRVSLPQAIVSEIDAKKARYQADANAALLQIAGECTREGAPEATHQRFTDWMLDHVPTCMIPECRNGLQIRAIKRGRGEAVPCEVVGWLDPIEALEKKTTITQNPDFFVKNLKSLSNDPSELAVTHINLTSLPDGDTPAWDEMRQKFTDDEWAVLCAYIYATFDMTNFSRQALVLYDNGHTGKSTLFTVLAWALGGKENCAYPDPLLSPKDDKFYTSQYYGKHVVFIPDCKNPNLLRTGWIHSYTGGDTVSIQYKGRNAFSARCYGKAFIATNTIPSLDVQAEHIKTRLIILRPQLTQEAIERLGQRDSQGEFIRDESGKIVIKGDPRFETRLKEEFWAFLKKCKAHYDRLCPDGCTIQLPKNVRENSEIAEDYTTSLVLEICDKLFTYGSDCHIHTSELRYVIQDELDKNGIRNIDIPKILQILAENRGIVRKKSVKVGGKVSTGYDGLETKVQADLSQIMDPSSNLESLDLTPLDLSDL